MHAAFRAAGFEPEAAALDGFAQRALEPGAREQVAALVAARPLDFSFDEERALDLVELLMTLEMLVDPEKFRP